MVMTYELGRLDRDFFAAVEALDQNWSMGVELVSPFLYSLIRMTRPRKVLEIGAGYSSVFILQALEHNVTEYHANKKLLQGQHVNRHTGLRRLLHGKGLLRRHPLPWLSQNIMTPTIRRSSL